MADVSRTVYLSRKLSNINEESSKHVYDGIFSAPMATKHHASAFAARIDDYREIFPPSKASLGSTIPVLDLPAVDRSGGPGQGVSDGFDYAGVFGGLEENEGIEVPSDNLFRDSVKSAKRDAQPPRIPVPTRRMPSKSQEFSRNYENDQTSSPGKTRRMPSKSQEFSCNYGNDQTSCPVQARRVPSRSQVFSSNYGNDETSIPVQMRRMQSNSQGASCNYLIDHTPSPIQTRKISSKSQESSSNHGKDQTPSPAQTMRMPSKSQEFPCNYGNYQPASDSSPLQTRRVPSKSQDFSCNYGTDQISSPAQPTMQYSRNQELSSNIPNNKTSTSPAQTRRPLSGEGDKLSGTPPNDLTSGSALPHQTVDNVKHVSVSYNKTNQLSKDGPNGMTHIAHLHAVPGYTLLFDEAGPVSKTSFDKAKRLSMNDADFCGAVAEVSRQGKHTRAVSDLGTNQQASDHDPGFQERSGGDDKQEADCKPHARNMSVSNSPQSSESSDYFRRSSRRRPNRSKRKQEKNASGYSSLLLDEALDVNSPAAISATAMKNAIEDAEKKIQWARKFLKDLEGIGFIKPTLKDSFKVKVKVDNDHPCETYWPRQNGSLKVKAARKKKCFNEEKVLKQNGYVNSEASGSSSHAYEAGEIKPKVDLDIASQEKQLDNEAAALKRKVDLLDAGLDTTETLEETDAHDELKFAEKSCKDEGGGEWEAAKHISQLFTGVKNRFVSFMSKQADTEKRAIQKDASSKCESLEQSRETAHEVRNVDTNQETKADLDHTEEKAEIKRRGCAVTGESAHDFVGRSINMSICEEKNKKDNASSSTLSQDNKMCTGKQCRPSEHEEELERIEAQELENRTTDLNQDTSTEVKGELLQDVREQNQEMLDETVKIEPEIQMGTVGLEERDKLQEKASQSQAYDDTLQYWQNNKGVGGEVPGLESVQNRVDESLKIEVLTGRQVDGCTMTDIAMQKDAQMKLQEDVRMVKETCMVDECYERIAGQDVTSGAAEGLIKVIDDVSKHDKHISATNELSEQDELFLSKNKEAVPDVQGVKIFSEEKGTSELIGEGVCEQTPCSVEVIDDDDSEHDEYLPAVDDILEQDEFLSSSRNEEAFLHDTVSQCAFDVRLTEAMSSTFEPVGKIEESRSVQMADELNRECNSKDSGSRGRAADESLEHAIYLTTADDVCDKDAEARYQDESQYAEEGKVDVEKERMTIGQRTCEFESPERPSSRLMENELIGDEMTETSMSAKDDSNITKKESEEANDAAVTEKYEQKHSEEEIKFAKENDPENQDDDLEVSTRETNEAANEQNISLHSRESSHKRRRWFVSREEVAKFQPDIFQGNERNVELELENAESRAVEDKVESCVDETVSEGVSIEQADADIDQDQKGHRRRRWFENRDEQRPNEIAQEFENDVSSQPLVDKLVNERHEGVDGMESSNMTSENVECRASTESGHRRRRWFENGGKLGAAQDEEIEVEANTTKNDHNETASSAESANTREKEKERIAVERVVREARQRAFFEARDRAAAVKAAAAIQDRPGKASSEVKSISEKASMDAKIRAERAAVERATAEARERALQKSISEKGTFKSVDFKNLNSGPSSSGYSTSVPYSSERPYGATTESPQRRKAISERNKRTSERAAKALEEKNMRDILVQKEQTERNRFSGVLDAEVKRWSTGKEGNLRSLLSTLQYVLGPDSGWQSIPLTDLVTTTAVRKAYKRAALCVHPDKLQQRRATIQQKYVCEKVFDLLKDAWNKFNPDNR